MASASIAAILLDVLTLVKAGFALKEIVAEIRMMEAGGASQEEISLYLKKLRDDNIAKLKDATKPN